MDMATQQTAPDHQIPVGEQSFSAQDNGLAVLIGSAGMTCTWVLRPDREELSWVIGRGANADFQLPVSRKRLSSSHFRIWATRDEPPTIMMRDMSTNGTFLNNTRMPKDRNCMLVNGDVITVGLGVPSDEIKFVVSIPKTSQAAPQGGVYEAYDLGEVVGQGAFALVRQAVHRETGEKVAIKIIDRAKITGSIQTSVEREIGILKRFRHEHIVKLHDIFIDDKYYFLVMDFVPHGDLMDFLLRRQTPQQLGIPEDMSREIVRQVLEAVKYVHEMGVSHRDLKPDNILVNSYDPVTVKVADFGLAKLQGQGTFLKTFCGTLSYLAPEVMQSRSPEYSSTTKNTVYTSLVDIWSVGCMAYVILTGCMPFGGATQEELFKTVVAGKFHEEPLKAAQISAEGADFIRFLLDVNTETRPLASAALEHPWFHPDRTLEEFSPSLRVDSTDSAAHELGASQIEAHSLPSLLPNSLPSQLPSHLPSQLPSDLPSDIGPEPSRINAAGGLKSEIPGMSSLGLYSSVRGANPRLEPLDESQAEQKPEPQDAAGPQDEDWRGYERRGEVSEPDDDDVKQQVALITSQHRVLSQSADPRDLDDLAAAAGDDELPPGTWGQLETLPTSVPCKDLVLTKDSFTIGRHDRTRAGPAPDYSHDDPRLSRVHCRIYREEVSVDEPGAGPRYAVFIEAYNQMYIGRTRLAANTRMRVYGDDRVCLFVQPLPTGAEKLVFRLRLYGDNYLRAKRPNHEKANPVTETVSPPRKSPQRSDRSASLLDAMALPPPETPLKNKREHSSDLVPQPKRLHTVFE